MAEEWACTGLDIDSGAIRTPDFEFETSSRLGRIGCPDKRIIRERQRVAVLEHSQRVGIMRINSTRDILTWRNTKQLRQGTIRRDHLPCRIVRNSDSNRQDLHNSLELGHAFL